MKGGVQNVIPSYQAFMYPLLKLLGDGKEHSLQEAYEHLARVFKLSEAEKKEKLPSGQLVYKNRISWARTYLNKAGLIKNVRRGIFAITPKGMEVLRDPKIQNIDTNFLMQFDEFKQFRNKRNSVKEEDSSVEEELTPLELLEQSYNIIKQQTVNELLEKVKNCSSEFFEKLVVELIVAMGYGGSIQEAGKAIGKSGDEGIDGVIKEDVLGLDIIYVQAKRWDNPVGRPEIQKFAGSLEGQRAKKGIFITTSDFTDGAKEYVSRIEKKIILINGQELAEYMFKFNIGVSKAGEYILKKIDMDYFDESNEI